MLAKSQIQTPNCHLHTPKSYNLSSGKKRKASDNLSSATVKRRGNYLMEKIEDLCDKDGDFKKFVLRKIYCQNKEISAEVLSKEISDRNKITPKEANGERVNNNMTVHGYRKMKQNMSQLKEKVKGRGTIILDYHPSERKIYAAREKNTRHCEKEDYYLGKLCLEKNKEGKIKRKTQYLSVLIRKELLSNIESVIEETK